MSALEKANLYHYIASVKRRWPLCLAIFISIILLGVIYTARIQKLYKSSATIVIMPTTPQILTGLQEVTPTTNWFAEEANLQTEYQTMSSRQISKRVYERMNLAKRKQYKDLNSETFLSNYVTINPQKKTRIVSVDVVHPDPKFAADLANSVVAVYLDYKLAKKRESSRQAEVWLLAQHETLKKKLEQSEKSLYDYMQDNGILNASLESQMEAIKSRISTFTGKLAEVQAQEISGRVDAQALSRVSENPKLLDSLSDIQKAPMISELKGRLIELKGQRLELSQRYLPDYPKVKVVDAEIASVEETLRDEVKNTIDMLDRERESLRATESGLKEAIAEEREQEAHLNKLNFDYGRLKREVDTNTKLYDMVTNRLKEIGLTGMLVSNNVSLVDEARVPTAPYQPDWKINLAVAFLLALFFAVGIALLLELMDQTFKSQADVESFLGLPFLGVLPNIAAEAVVQRDLYTRDHPKSIVAECCRGVRTNLLFMSPDKPFKTLLIASSTAREGKTTTAIGLSVAMAQAGSRVLLIDCDLRKPRVYRSFELPNDVGVSSVIVGETKLGDAICRTSLANLDVLSSGPIPPNPSELFHTQRFKELLEELKLKYDKIIFDAPPVGAVTDPVVLAAQLDGCMVVIKTRVTHREGVKRTVRMLNDAHARIFGVVLNDFMPDRSETSLYSKYYFYGRYYTQYGEQPST